MIFIFVIIDRILLKVDSIAVLITIKKLISIHVIVISSLILVGQYWTFIFLFAFNPELNLLINRPANLSVKHWLVLILSLRNRFRFTLTFLIINVKILCHVLNIWLLRFILSWIKFIDCVASKLSLYFLYCITRYLLFCCTVINIAVHFGRYNRQHIMLLELRNFWRSIRTLLICFKI